MTAARAKKGARGADEVKPDTAGLPPVPAGLPRIAVAFGGGGARGLAHIHVIRELDALGIRPVAISGSSIGAIMGSAMAAGMTGDAIFDHARSVLSDKAEAASRLWRSRPASFSEMMSKGIRFSQFNIENILRSFLPGTIPATFEELSIPLTVTATDYYGHSLTLFREGELLSAVAASAAIPARVGSRPRSRFCATRGPRAC